MQMAEQFDISTLAWVKGEIDETLKQARIALESYVEDPDDESRLQGCIDYIHQVAGTLQMVELLGAALYADVVERFATALLENKIDDSDQGFELLMRAILQLPDYLESLLSGNSDNPVALVPLLNELRQLRGDAVLDTTQFFRPNLEVEPPPRKSAPAKGVTSQVAAKKLHRYYLGALAKLIKGDEVEPSLKTMVTVIDKFNGVAEGDLLRRLLWVASAFVEGLRDKAIELDKQTKPLLGRLEHHVKEVGAKGEQGLESKAVEKLLQAMLYQIANSEASGKHAAAVRLAFDLERFTPGGEAGLGGLNAELKQTVSADIMEELTRVKDSFDIFVRSDRSNAETLSPLADSLNNIAETLSLLQEESLRASLKEQVGVIHQLVDGKSEASDEVLMGVAGAILAVESALRDWGNNAPVVEADAREEQVDDAENSPQAIAEHQRVTRQVMKEAKDDLIRVREGINTYLDNPQDSSVLGALPEVLYTISGSLTMLSYKRVAEILNSTRAFIEQELIGSDTVPEQEKLDALADAVMSVEYYLEAFVHSRVHPGSVLDVAENAVTLAGYPIGSQRPVPVEEEAEQPEAEGIEVFGESDELTTEIEPDEQLGEPVAELGEQDEELAASETLETALGEDEKGPLSDVAAEQAEAELEEQANALVDQEPAAEPEEQAGIEADEEPTAETEEQVEAETTTEKQADTTPPAPSPAADIDDEILEIFIEEAEEELESIGRTLPAWSADTSDTESLQTLRRSFHTLKGSGRLVGATEVGEFAWAFENMLNRVIDGTVAPSATMFDMLEQAREALPELIEQFRSATPLQADVEMLQQMAFEIVEPGGLKMPEELATKKPAAESEPQTEQPVAEQLEPETEQPEPGVEASATAEELAESVGEEMPQLDPVLLEIYSKEADGHLEEIGQFIDNWRDGGSHKVNEPLIRALHTLQGSSRMAGVMSVAEVAAALEKYAKTLQASQQGINDQGIEALEACLEYIRAMLAYLVDGEGNMPDGTRAQQLADDVYADVQHMEEAAPAQPEAGLATHEETPSAESAEGEAEGAAEAEAEPAIPSGDSAAQYSGDETADEPVSGASSTAIEDTEGPLPDQATTQAPPSMPAPTVVEEEYDPDLLDIFLEEGSDILDSSEETLQAWVENPDDRSLVESLQRQLHTLKGGARMAGIKPIGDLSHSLESTFEAVVEGRIQRSPQMVDLLQLSHDRLVTMLEQVQNHEPVVTGDDLIHQVDVIAKGGELEAPLAQSPAGPPEEATDEGEPVEIAAADEADSDQQQREQPPAVEVTPDPMKGIELAVGELELNHSSWLRDVDDQEAFELVLQSAGELESRCREAEREPFVELAAIVKKLLNAILDGHVPASKKASDLISLALERIRHNLNRAHEGLEPESADFLVNDINELITRSLVEEGAAAAEASEAEAVASEPEPDQPEQKDEAAAGKRRAPRIQHEMVRVRADLLDNLVNFAGEVSIYRSRVEQQIGSFRTNIDEMDQTVERLREQVRQVEIENEAQIESRREEAQKLGYEDFDPLEFDRFTHMQQLSRSMAESLSDLLSIEDILTGLTRETETLLLQQSRVNTELQENLVHTRMVPLVQNAPRLRRIVRQTAAEVGKRASLNFEGAEVEMDRNVVERMMAPLEHMLRNSIAHGIEDKLDRTRKGKPEEGHITIVLSREGSEIVISIIDDGRGIDLDAVKSKAIERGLVKPDAKLSSKEIMRFILESGFSTAESLSQIAGRGVGMDVVNSEIKQLGGVMDIDSVQGQGTTFTVRIPLTLSVSRALLVQVGEDTYAIPLMSISGIERIETPELERLLADENPTFEWVGEEYELMHLTNVLGVGQGQVSSDMIKQPLLLARSGDNRIALAVDSLMGSREIVVKSLGPQLSTLQDLSGATILADGSVALIIDMPSLIRRGLARKAEMRLEEAAVAETEREPVVMVVDDSITVRKVTERLLKRHNMICTTAKDGVDALSVLEDNIPDVMLLDIEMPRMDGFELATHMRNSEKLRDIPIIMITSRTGEKHRQRALDIGVNIYMGKPYTEVDLLENIETLLGKKS